MQMQMHTRCGRFGWFYLARKFLLLALSLGFLLSACRSTGVKSNPTPTAFPEGIPSLRITTTAPIPITLEYLTANPDFYVGATLHLTGQFRRLPVLACEGESFPSPATWGLQANGSFANASGMDAQLRSLLDEEQLITVEGRWLKYEGPVGCETNLQDQTIWYLSGDRVLDPHPLVRSLVTPIVEAPVSTAIAELPAVTIEQAEQATMTAIPSLDATATAVPSFTPVGAATAPVITATASITPTASATAVGDLATPTLSANLTHTVQADGSPSPTPDGSATVTVTPGASATPSGALVDKGNLDSEDLTISQLGAGATDRWQLDLSAGDVITITVAPGSSADIVLSVLDSDGVSLVSEQNLAAAGEVETVTDLNITDPGIHDLLIRTVQGTQTDYALMFMDADSYSFIFRGTLPENTTRSDALLADNDHFWFFTAQGGESVSFSITPESGKDPYIELYDPGGARMLTIDDSGVGEVESMDNYTLLDSGIYGIRVAEFDFLPMSYQIVLTKP
jgi:hypothetical protein